MHQRALCGFKCGNYALCTNSYGLSWQEAQIAQERASFLSCCMFLRRSDVPLRVRSRRTQRFAACPRIQPPAAPPQAHCRKNDPKKHRLRARSAFSGRCIMPCPCARACFPPRKAGTSPRACERRLIPLRRLPSSARQRERLHLAPPRGARRGARRIPRESCRRWNATRTKPRR